MQTRGRAGPRGCRQVHLLQATEAHTCAGPGPSHGASVNTGVLVHARATGPHTRQAFALSLPRTSNSKPLRSA